MWSKVLLAAVGLWVLGTGSIACGSTSAGGGAAAGDRPSPPSRITANMKRDRAKLEKEIAAFESLCDEVRESHDWRSALTRYSTLRARNGAGSTAPDLLWDLDAIARALAADALADVKAKAQADALVGQTLGRDFAAIPGLDGDLRAAYEALADSSRAGHAADRDKRLADARAGGFAMTAGVLLADRASTNAQRDEARGLIRQGAGALRPTLAIVMPAGAEDAGAALELPAWLERAAPDAATLRVEVKLARPALRSFTRGGLREAQALPGATLPDSVRDDLRGQIATKRSERDALQREAAATSGTAGRRQLESRIAALEVALRELDLRLQRASEPVQGGEIWSVSYPVTEHVTEAEGVATFKLFAGGAPTTSEERVRASAVELSHAGLPAAGLEPASGSAPSADDATRAWRRAAAEAALKVVLGRVSGRADVALAAAARETEGSGAWVEHSYIACVLAKPRCVEAGLYRKLQAAGWPDIDKAMVLVPSL